MKRSVFYGRVSSAGQLDGTSSDTQEADCRALGERLGYPVVAVVSDDGETGMNSTGYRPGWQRVMAMLRRQEVDALITWKQDRQARGGADPLTVSRELHDLGARWFTVMDGEIVYDSMGQVMTFFRGWKSEQEWNDTRQRTQRGVRSHVEDRRRPLPGRYPLFGYRYVFDTQAGRTHKRIGYENDPEEEPIVVRCYEAVAGGQSLNSLARQLNAEGVPTHTQRLQQRGQLKEGAPVARRWSRQVLRGMILNPAYKGSQVVFRRVTHEEKVNGGTEKPRTVVTMRPEEETVTLPMPAIVSEELWARAGAEMKERKADSPRRNSDPEATLLRAGIALCGHCGKKMTVCRTTSGARRYWAYTCHGCRDRDPKTVFTLGASKVDADVWAKAVEVGRDQEKVKRILETRQRERAEQVQHAEASHEQATKLLAEATEKRDNLLEQMASTGNRAVRDALEEKLARVLEELAGLERKVRATQLEVNAVRMSTAWDGLAALFSRKPDMERLTYAEKRHVLNVLGVQVLMYRADSDYTRKTGRRAETVFTVDGDSDNNEWWLIHMMRMKAKLSP